MKRLATPLIPALLIGASSIASAAEHPANNVQVTYVGDMGQYADASLDGWHSPKAYERTRDKINDIFVSLGQEYLTESQRLEIEVLDIDLAGSMEPLAVDRTRDVRKLRNITWPSIKMRYKLYDGDAVVTEGTEEVKDMGYLSRFNPQRYNNDTVRYERQMLNDWFRERVI